jgi:hypothetical protein
MKQQNVHREVLLQHLIKIFLFLNISINSILLISLKTKGESVAPLRQVILALRNVVHVLAIIVAVSTSF